LIAESDIVASIAHVKMLSAAGLLESEEEKQINLALLEQFERVASNSFSIDKDVEDIHSQLEKILIRKLGDTGKKVHTARSRNDQVMTALKLYYRQEVSRIVFQVKDLITVLLKKAEKTSDIMLPGYTHLQVAMYSSFGLWFSAWAEAFAEDLFIVGGTMDYINQNPLGSAAGYGSSFPIDRDLTTKLLAFNDMHINSINAQLSRGKTEKLLMSALSAVAGDLSKMAMDLVLFLNQNFDFVYLDDELTTGSSIMPHKKILMFLNY
jgi:argininosuccinate lyase